MRLLNVLFRPNAMKSMQNAFAQCQQGVIKQAEILTRNLSDGRVARTVTMPIEGGHRTFIQIADKNGREICHKTKDSLKQTIFSEDLQSLFPNINHFTFRKTRIMDEYAPHHENLRWADLRTSLSGDGKLLGSYTPRGYGFGYANPNTTNIIQHAASGKADEAHRFVNGTVAMDAFRWNKISVG